MLLTAGQRRRADREERRQAKDAAYELRQQRKKAKDGTSWRGHHIVDSSGLDEAFPAPETPELPGSTVRRRIIHGVVLVLLLALVVSGVVLAGMVQRGEMELKLGPGKPTPIPETCPAEMLDYPANDTITVNVFNAGSVEGRAGVVAEELKKRGFIVKTVGNGTTKYSRPAIIVSGPGGHAAAFALQKNVSSTEYVEDDRKDGSVDIVLTGTFVGLLAVPKVDHTPGLLSCPRLSPPAAAPAE
ncbi:hypothetical protein ART_2388 [Arthrobacter sp. PAMC 25486]|nr:hypothetical protein ART_2388 [Arthrobacter sp. PAMC 25486]